MSAAAQARPRRFLWTLWLVCLVLDVVTIWLLATLSTDQKIYLRNILFARIHADRDITNEAGLDRLLMADFKEERDTRQYLNFLNRSKAAELMQLAIKPGTTDLELARSITAQLGKYSDGRVCGLESLGRTVFDTELGLGCCSDFSKSWIFYARYLGLTVREVSNLNHTTAEYFDRQARRWRWLDPSNRTEIIDASNMPASQYSIRSNSLFNALRMVPLMEERPDFVASEYPGYAPTQYAVLMWRLGTNFLEIERHDSTLRRWGLGKSQRQMVLLLTNVQPRYFILTPNALAAYLRALQAFLYTSLALLLFAHAGLAAATLHHLIAARRSRRALPPISH